MKIIHCLLLTFFLFLPAQAEVTSSFWQTSKSQHFIIYYQEAPSSFVDELMSRAENYYNGIMDNIGFRRFDFWSWENRAKIYLYDNQAAFQKETQRSSWAGAVVSVHNRVIKTYVGQSAFFDSILPHEMTHIIFREFIGKDVPLPLWIDEGVSSSQEQGYLNARLQFARDLIVQNKYLSIETLSGINRIDESVSPNVFYAQAASLIVFLIRDKGKENFLDFSRRLRDGTEWKTALLKAFNFSSLRDLETGWKNYMLKL